MTGEMSWIKPNGDDSNGDSWPTHAVIAAAIRGDLRPFDVYTGPYISTSEGKLFLGEDEGGTYVCLWPDGQAPAFRKPIVRHYDWTAEEAVKAAKACCAEYRKQRKT